MAQKRIQYVKTETGQEKQYIGSHSTIVDIDTIAGLEADNLQEALVELTDLASTGGVTSVNGKTGAVTISKSDLSLGNVTNDAQVKRSEMGKASGVATLGTDGKVPSSQLPSYVDDVLEYTNKAGFPATGETGKIYIAKDTNITYRWGGSAYVEISASLALGETSSTAYAGDKGKAIEALANSVQGSLALTQADIAYIKNGTTKVGKAESADKLATARTISLSGDATGSASFDGSANKSIAVTLANSGVTAGTYSAVTVDAKGRATAGAQIVEWGTSTQTTPSANLAVGGLFFQLVE